MISSEIELDHTTDGSPQAELSPTHNINVICRFRPILSFELDRNQTSNYQFPSNSSVKVSTDLPDFNFDRVFRPEHTQADVYGFSINPIVEDFLCGYNGTVLAYGQTGSGKSYTMMGPSLYEEDKRGIIPRISQDIFAHIQSASSDIEYTVAINFYEIYMEKIQDLLCPPSNTELPNGLSSPTANSPSTPKNSKFSITQDKINGISIKGLYQVFVASSEEMLQVLQRGLKNRTNSPTLMNEESSRSHAIFQIKLTQKHLETEITKRSQLFLVDLAGSEKVDKTGAIGQNLEEAKTINKSLSALGNVINALTDGKSTHIPYRDSKLTRIIQESLGGNARTSLIINCSSSSDNETETLSTLRFGTRAKRIKNSPRMNTELSPASLQHKLLQLEKLNQYNQSYIKDLEEKLHRYKENPSLIKSNLDYTDGDNSSSKLPEITTNLHEEIERRDRKIAELEDRILNIKMDNLRNNHSEESKLFILENALCKLNDKLTEVELVNVNLRKHLLMSEKIIESRDLKVNQLKTTLKEQQSLISKETVGFKYKLSDIQSKLESLNQQKQHITESQSSIQSENEDPLKREMLPEVLKPTIV